ncbi:unnamed protein product [Moneuplotes crassus]|uniref:Uncharacterized protein n=1 Tax=Euplotes crassus TaxID=5936 RepID=A0AAD2DB26_EUPCR|nr:unnamed protein product [Moneuplotes crassus]
MDIHSLIKSPCEPKDIWATEFHALGEDAKESVPQIPKTTKQFVNTLRTNKGKPIIGDFKSSSKQRVCTEHICVPPRFRETCQDCSEQLIELKSRHKTKLKDYKPMTFNMKATEKWDKLGLKAQKSELLRKLPSDEILKSMLG